MTNANHSGLGGDTLRKDGRMAEADKLCIPRSLRFGYLTRLPTQPRLLAYKMQSMTKHYMPRPSPTIDSCHVCMFKEGVYAGALGGLTSSLTFIDR